MNRGPSAERPVIEHYTDYRAWLRDMLAWKKSQPGRYSFQKLADESGVGTAAYLNMVVNGKRNLKPSAAKGLGRALGLRASETAFLKKLIELDRVSDPLDRQKKLRHLARRQGFRERFQIDADQLDYLSNWYVLAIHEMAGGPGFRADPAWVARQLRPQITEKQAKEALELLERLELIRIHQDGRVERTVERVETPDEFVHDVVRGYHAQAADLARWAVEHTDAADRNFSVLVGRVDERGFRELMSRLYDYRDQLFELLSELESPDGDTVVQINLQAFPLTPVPQPGGEEGGAP